jgi:hypothetical protein
MSASGGNNIGSLLSSDPGSVRLMMGVQLVAPEARIALEKILPFNIQAAMVENIANAHFPKAEDQSTLWTPAKPLPLPKEAGAEATEGTEGTSEENQWTAVSKAWQGSDSKSTVEAWAAIMRWKTDLGDKDANVEPLSTAKPEYMIKRIPNLFLEAPRMLVVA